LEFFDFVKITKEKVKLIKKFFIISQVKISVKNSEKYPQFRVSKKHLFPMVHLEPHWIVGFVDGEGCFAVSVIRHPDMKFGYEIQPELTVTQHKRDIHRLYALKSFFQCGVVGVNHGSVYHWRVRDRKHLIKAILTFFEKHPLKGKRQIEFLVFRDIVHLMDKGVHLTEEGFNLVVAKAKSLRITKEYSSVNTVIKTETFLENGLKIQTDELKIQKD
jgi:hypothetical protein